MGSSSALPTSKRFPAAYVLNAHERFFLIDCGEGTQIQLRKYKIKLNRLDHIFISHIHGDHVFGLFGLISSLSLIGRNHELHIYGPRELKQILNIHIDLFDLYLGYKLTFHSVDCKKSELLYSDKKIEIESFPLKHRIPTCGFLFREKPKIRSLKKEMLDFYNIPIQDRNRIKEGVDFISESGEIIPNKILTNDPPPSRSFAYCTDTIFDRGIISKVKSVDLLFHESTFMEDELIRAKETFHSTAKQAASIAKEAEVKKLLLGHFSARYKDLSPLLNEAKSIFSEVILAEEGNTIDI